MLLRKVIPVIFIFLLFSFHQSESVNDIIRRKLEDVAISELTAFNEKLYCSKSIQEFYQIRLFESAWDSKTSSQLLLALQKSKEEGLQPQDYHVIKINELGNIKRKTNFEQAEYDLLLTDAFLLYISHLLSGKVNPQTIDPEWHVVRREGNPMELLKAAIASGDINSTMQAAMPVHGVYKSLKKTLKLYRAIELDWSAIPEGITIKKGKEDERIPSIADRLFILGDLKVRITENSKLYEDNIFAAIQHFQKRHGLDNKGEIGVQTIGALNISVEKRIQQIEANMERWRWLPLEFGPYYLKVNIANFELEVIKDGELVRSHNVIVGKPFRRTPVFSSQMKYLVLNPTWTVPPGIIKADIIPAVQKDASYLVKKKLTVMDAQGNPVSTTEIDWNGKAAKNYTYIQPPGPTNALGAVKFMFPNNFHVYLHDTPSKDLFDKTERAFSSGCIRVNEPLSLAEYLLNDEVKWNREKIDKIVATRKTQTIHLIEQPNVYLLYWTAWSDDNEIVQFRKDIYDRDNILIKRLKENR